MSRRLQLVVAMARNRTIGRDGGLPWHLPADLRRFKSVTLGTSVVMGRRTYESIGHALPGRQNVVMSRDPGYAAQGCTVVASLREAIDASVHEACMIIGGEAVFAAALPFVERIILTRVEADVEGDVKFPEFDPDRWHEHLEARYDADDRHAYAYSFSVLERAA